MKAVPPPLPAHLLAEHYKKADLHCHSRFSYFKYFKYAKSRDSYNDPEEVYRTLKARGMDYVTLTDHDSIEGCLYVLNRNPDLTDFFVSEEIETHFPYTRQRIHLNLFDITEEQHREAQRLRPNIYELAGYLKDQGITTSVNHMFQNFRTRNNPRRFIREMLQMFEIFEIKNGAMAADHNQLVDALLKAVQLSGGRISVVGGSDAHTLHRLGCVYTIAEGTNVAEFLVSLRSGKSFAWGIDGSYNLLLREVYTTVFNYVLDVTDMKNAEYTRQEKVVNVLFTLLIALPISAVGFPLGIASLNYLKQRAVSRTIGMLLKKYLKDGDLIAHREQLPEEIQRVLDEAERPG